MEDEDDFIFCGTPLPELDDDVVIKKKANQDLTVRDEKGRQRFHGAFTGGYSAGYFNTVGTKEGWEPASFVSSRASKASSSSSSSFQQNPEDFMDEEDFGQFGIAPKKIHTTTNFRDAQTSSTRKRGHITNDDVIPGEPPLRDLIKPVMDSIGMRILKEMGWRHGQGIGPRVKKKIESESSNQKIVGCSLGPLASMVHEDPMQNQMTFAPDDTPDVPYTPKDDRHGIGYSGLSTQSVLSLPLDDAFSLSKTKSWLAKDKRKLTIRGQAFGVGAFEDDDEDIYSKDDMSQYDFSEFAGSKGNTHNAKTNPTGARDKYGSIVEILEGFTLATKPPTAKKYFAPPALHPKFKPKHKSLPVAETPADSNIAKPKLGHIVRSIMLGEQNIKPDERPQVPAKPRRSRFDVGPSETQVQGSPSSVITSSKFKPFVRDSEKQSRYEEFIKMKCDKDQLKLLQPPSMTEWERQQETDEFAKASSLYQPMSRALESRFESHSHLGLELALPVMKLKEKEPDIAAPVTSSKEEKATRETFEWHPLSLLCKRFNIPNPYPNSKDEGIPNSEKKKKLSLFDNLFPDTSMSSSSALGDVVNAVNPQDQSQETASSSTSPVSVELPEVTRTLSVISQETPKGSKPPMDLFKEIFKNSSSEDSSSDEENNKDKNVEPEKPPALDVAESDRITKQTSNSLLETSEIKDSPVKPNSETPTSSKKGFGVFANIDLDALNKRTPSSYKPHNAAEEQPTQNNNSSDQIKPPDDIAKNTNSEKEDSTNTPEPIPKNMFYGPEPPPTGPAPVIKHTSSEIHKHSKHKHKHHKHKDKKKKKHKKHSRKDSKKHSSKDSDQSSIDSDEDIPPSQILEKLKLLKELEKSTRKQRK